jgi:phosphatidylglycerophosphate synthase
MSGTAATVTHAAPPPRRRMLLVAPWIAFAAVAGAALAALLQRLAGLEPGFVWRALLLLAGGGALLLIVAARHWNAASFGAANLVTLARGALTLLLLGMLGALPTAAIEWSAVGLALAGLVLDGVDGRLARTRREVSAFGARFDMETDALLIVALAALAWQFGKAGVWVLLAGLLRYLFVAAGCALPWLARELPPSRRRQAVCVVQIASLIACVSPLFAPPLSGAIALLGLAALVSSFAIDVAWLARRARD